MNIPNNHERSRTLSPRQDPLTNISKKEFTMMPQPPTNEGSKRSSHRFRDGMYKNNSSSKGSVDSEHRSQLSNNKNESFTKSFTSAYRDTSLDNASRERLRKQVEAVSKQKKLLDKLKREKEKTLDIIEQHEMSTKNRMLRLHLERKQKEERIINAAITIQKHVRRFIAKICYERMLVEREQRHKRELKRALSEMQKKSHKRLGAYRSYSK